MNQAPGGVNGEGDVASPLIAEQLAQARLLALEQEKVALLQQGQLQSLLDQ